MLRRRERQVEPSVSQVYATPGGLTPMNMREKDREATILTLRNANVAVSSSAPRSGPD